jgi:hypothetical protein
LEGAPEVRFDKGLSAVLEDALEVKLDPRFEAGVALGKDMMGLNS